MHLRSTSGLSRKFRIFLSLEFSTCAKHGHSHSPWMSMAMVMCSHNSGLPHDPLGLFIRPDFTWLTHLQLTALRVSHTWSHFKIVQSGNLDDNKQLSAGWEDPDLRLLPAYADTNMSQQCPLMLDSTVVSHAFVSRWKMQWYMRT